MHPLEGETLVTKFQLAASNWLDREDHLPLQYRFGYIDAEKREVEIKFSLSSTAETSLPPGKLKIYSALPIIFVMQKRIALTKILLDVQLCITRYKILSA